MGGRNLTGKETSLNISVDSEGYYYIGTEEIPADRIVAKVTAVREANPEINVVISGDTDAQYGRVIGLMAMLKNAGLKSGIENRSRTSADGKEEIENEIGSV